jgi:steroid delta-isomerase-like uncharacterized protein
MSAEDTVRRYIDAVWNQGEPQALIELTTPDFTYCLGGLPPLDRGAMAEFVRATRVAFPDWRVNIDDVVASGDRVAVRWSGLVTHEGAFHGIPPTGRRIAVTGINIYAVEAGLVKAEWEETDSLGILRQLGVLPGG